MNRKPHIEFEMVSNENGWETPLGYPKGIKQKILASDICLLYTSDAADDP